MWIQIVQIDNIDVANDTFSLFRKGTKQHDPGYERIPFQNAFNDSREERFVARPSRPGVFRLP